MLARLVLQRHVLADEGHSFLNVGTDLSDIAADSNPGCPTSPIGVLAVFPDDANGVVSPR
jgi:hypothetical protein